LSNRPAAALQRRTLLEGVVLAARAPGHNVRHRPHSAIDSLSLARPCHLLALRRLSRCMSSGALVRATSVSVVVLCAVLVVTRSRGFSLHPRGVELGVLAVGVEGVCCKPKGWCGVVAIR
jgi:hypothetical protein